jgi:hypothetical protein
MSEEPLPLASHVHLETDDLDEARERLGPVLRPHRPKVTRGGADLHVVHHMAKLGSTAFHYVDYGTDVQVSSEQGFMVVELPLAGTTIVRAGSHEVVATPEVAAVSAPTDAPSIQYLAPNPRLMISIDPALLDSRLALALGDRPRRPVRFDPTLDLTSTGGRSWRPAGRHDRRRLRQRRSDQPVATGSGVARARAGRRPPLGPREFLFRAHPRPGLVDASPLAAEGLVAARGPLRRATDHR